jgi:Domain of unknown function (DUF4349)
MPSLPESALDERFEELAALIRASKPRAPQQLRERVHALAAAEPEPRRWRRPARRRAALVLVPALLVAVVAGAAILGISSRDAEQSAARKERPLVVDAEALERGSAHEDRAAAPSTALPPGRRAQNYRAELRVRVRDVGELSQATARAMRVTRSLGGFVLRADYDAAGAREGDSVLVVRVPVRKVQKAIVRFSQLGTIVGQRIAIEDLQGKLDRQREAIAALRRTIATLERELRRPDLTADERAELRLRLVRVRESLAVRVSGRQATTRRAATARIALTLTTRERVAPVKPDRPGYFERTVRDAASALAKALAWVLAVLIVASPFLAFGGIALLIERSRRRRADHRLLERTSA